MVDYRCEECNKAFDSEKSLGLHRQQEHSGSGLSESSPRNSGGSMKGGKNARKGSINEKSDINESDSSIEDEDGDSDTSRKIEK